MNILIVDDESMMHDILNRIMLKIFAGEPCQIAFAKNVTEAKAAIESQDFDLILSDVDMPDGKGTQLVPVARSRNALTAFVLMSGNKEPADHGADAYLMKGCDHRQIEDAVTEALAKRG